MKQRRDEAYVLGVHELGEADLIVTLLAEGAGRVRGVAASARKSRRRFGGALEPLTRVRAAWTESFGRDLHRIDSLESARSFAVMQSDPTIQAACAVLCEVAVTLERENEPDPRVFRLVGAVLEALEDGLAPWIAVRYFEYWMLRLHGVLADISACGACGRALSDDDPGFVAQREGLRCRACAAGHEPPLRPLGLPARAFLMAAAILPPARMGAYRNAAPAGGALEELLLGGLEGFAERRFKTYRHLAAATRDDDRRGA
jgi:DNA repair protein RecO (recombination protein O)